MVAWYLYLARMEMANGSNMMMCLGRVFCTMPLESHWLLAKIMLLLAHGKIVHSELTLGRLMFSLRLKLMVILTLSSVKHLLQIPRNLVIFSGSV